ncbi:hypothetical protein B0H63DRAFT_523321 [Podospora didyma]|uniref:Uncharacterized protein n=1 Tax=Podospora didyma TaxID=330526 RepID=A0AAE0NQT4_9PEZI|nr:hypothetical protein B0H63DRAFT_523321 [Podospora didyma]
MATPENRLALALSFMATTHHMALMGTYTDVSPENLDAAPEPKALWDIRNMDKIMAKMSEIGAREQQLITSVLGDAASRSASVLSALETSTPLSFDMKSILILRGIVPVLALVVKP